MSGDSLVITIAQVNPTVGDVPGNFGKIAEAYLEGERRGAALVLTPAYSLSGAPLDDLAESRDFLDAVNDSLAAAGKLTEGRRAALVVGLPWSKAPGTPGHAAVVLRDGRVAEVVGVEHAHRVFTVQGVRVGLFTGGGVWPEDAASKADLIVRAGADVFRQGGLAHRVNSIGAPSVAASGVPFVSVNMVGGQDEFVFDGGSFALDARGKCVVQLPQWEECARTFSVAEEAEAGGGREFVFPEEHEELWRAMVISLRDYVRKSGFTDVVLGLSGGMDSAAVAAVAGDALGAEHVHCVRLPSQYTSELSNSAAEAMCGIWGFPMDTLPIRPLVDAGTAALGSALPEGMKKLTLENMQARIRCLILMTLSNDRGWLLLCTDNKSEIAVGYSTLYGDMAGGYNPLKDVFKTTVYALAAWRNVHRPAGLLGPEGIVIPQSILDRPPSAELSPEQLDADSLPPYPVLDAILRELIENDTPVGRIDHDPAVVQRVYCLLRNAEYKRRQSAPGPKMGSRAFCLEYRLPMVNKFAPAQP